MTFLHTEKALEDEICRDLAAAGWLHDAADAARYDRALALFPDDAVGWIQDTQPEAWASIEQTHGANARKVVCERLRRSLTDHGTLHVLRHGFELLGLRRPLAVAQFKPALAMNAALQAKYAANRLRVVRQLRYSVHNENCLDLGLFVNGIPVATVEIKTDYTQAVEDAVLQY
ncbi:type I restriction endonuclease [Thauera aromatica]|uniref:type I restriction endonuclease n=1 Tax=Thauera aromatica TaxID=59405 RepID=UPI001FFD86AD|nr:type I restriction endonuclease [Thauera aromatica]MCK2097777.1 type I restriction endonuclease [Thauera aromatica]